MKHYQQLIKDRLAKGAVLIFRPRCNGKKMSHHYFLNPDHTYRPCDLMTWARQFENEDRCVDEHIINNYRISTVWMGINILNQNPPLVFETMIFKPEGNDNYCFRYSTWDEALEGHQKAIQWVKNGCKDDE